MAGPGDETRPARRSGEWSRGVRKPGRGKAQGSNVPKEHGLPAGKPGSRGNWPATGRPSSRTHTGACPPRKKTERPFEQTACGLGGAVTAHDLRAGPRLRRACDPMSAAGWTIVRPGCAAHAAGASKSDTLVCRSRMARRRALNARGRPANTGEPAGRSDRREAGQYRRRRVMSRPIGCGAWRPARESWLLHGQVDARPASAAGVTNLTRGARTTCRVMRSGPCPGRRCGESAVPSAHSATGHARR